MIAVIIAIAPFIILPVFFNNIPPNIPAFVDVFGNPTQIMATSYLSIFRLPLMGIVLQVICLLMFMLKLGDQEIKSNRLTWSIISIIISLKMSLTSLEVFIYNNSFLLQIFRIVILILVVSGIIVLIMSILKLCKNYKNYFKDYFTKILNWKLAVIITSICCYIILVLMPFYIM